MIPLNKVSPVIRRTLACAWVGLACGVAGLSAATVSVTDSVSTFSTFETPWGTTLSDVRWDQQTGQGADDFVGDGTNGYYGFYYKYGQIGGVDSMMFRVRLNAVASSFTGNLRIGVDGNGDGAIDLFFGVSTGQGQTPQIVFQDPSAGKTNVSPSTSGLDKVYGTIATTTSNYSYLQADDGSAFATGNGTGTANADMFLTFALPFSTFKSALEARLSGVTITVDSLLRFLAFTSTQGNAVNQDVYGLGTLSDTANANLRFDQGGGFTNYYSSTGAVIPEASTVVQGAAFLLSGLGVVLWRRRLALRDRSA